MGIPGSGLLRAVVSSATGVLGGPAEPRRARFFEERIHIAVRGLRDRNEDDAALLARDMLRAYLTEMANPLTPILGAGAALSAAVGAVLDAGLIIAVTAVSGLIGAIQRNSTDRAVARLRREAAVMASAVRDGRETSVPADELAVGDVPLTARQLLLVNLFTDLAPAMAVVLRPPHPEAAGRMLHEGPEASLGSALTEETVVRAVATTLGATAGWLAARFTGRAVRARTVALVALVGTQLGQTLLAGGRSRTIVAASLGSMAALAAVVQTPGLSHFFGCTPLGPVGWAIALTAATGATASSLVLPAAVSRVPAAVTRARAAL
ncbi:cation transporting ATPase C-terminal domain-containing protein [Streptomyces sp. NPDC002577]